MPFENIIEKTGVYVKFTGQISCSDIIESSDELFKEKGYKHFEYSIQDFSEITEIKLSKNDIIRLAANAASLHKWNTSLQLAMVVRLEDMQLTKQWLDSAREFGHKWNTKIFRFCLILS